MLVAARSHKFPRSLSHVTDFTIFTATTVRDVFLVYLSNAAESQPLDEEGGDTAWKEGAGAAALGTSTKFSRGEATGRTVCGLVEFNCESCNVFCVRQYLIRLSADSRFYVCFTFVPCM